MKFLKIFYAIFTYAITLVALGLFILFFENIYLEKTISTPIGGNFDWQIVVWNIGLISLFGVQHSVMARDWFKDWITTLLPKAIERVTYILLTSFVLAILISQWQPFGHSFWDFRGTWIGYVMYGISFLGLGISAVSASMINSRSFIGLEQIQSPNGTAHKEFVMPFLYNYVRHPIYFGLLIGFWTVPVMSQSGLLFSIYMTVYIVVGTYLEERNLVKSFGSEYEYYQERVPMLIPFLKF